MLPFDRETLLSVIQGSSNVRRHYDLLEWAQGHFQLLLPHEILLAAWGDPKLGLFYIDVISSLPGLRTGEVIDGGITPLVQDLFKRWEENGYQPCQVLAAEGFLLEGRPEGRLAEPGFKRMRAAVVHGIRDQRDPHFCLYAAFRADTFPDVCLGYLEVLLPHIDAASRQVAHLPAQKRSSAADPEVGDDFGLSGRENEILRWVRAGKTNQEIGLILGISTFTVKNHLQRIFKKLDVTSRAQAVDKLSRHRQL